MDVPSQSYHHLLGNLWELNASDTNLQVVTRCSKSNQPLWLGNLSAVTALNELHFWRSSTSDIFSHSTAHCEDKQRLNEPSIHSCKCRVWKLLSKTKQKSGSSWRYKGCISNSGKKRHRLQPGVGIRPRIGGNKNPPPIVAFRPGHHAGVNWCPCPMRKELQTVLR